jgi:hypothetical protein
MTKEDKSAIIGGLQKRLKNAHKGRVDKSYIEKLKKEINKLKS